MHANTSFDVTAYACGAGSKDVRQRVPPKHLSHRHDVLRMTEHALNCHSACLRDVRQFTPPLSGKA
jgi:hypothetical protein